MFDSFTVMMIAVSLVVLGAGIVLMLVGRGGRRKGNAPHCLKCDYNLTGLGENTTRCPECGGGLAETTVGTGARRRRPKMVLTGLIMAALAGASVIQQSYALVSDYDWIRVKPLNDLLAEAKDIDGTADPIKKVLELERRCRSGKLSTEDLRTLIGKALDFQSGLESRRYSNENAKRRWLAILDFAYRDRAMTSEEEETYLRGVAAFNFDVRKKVRQGGKLPVKFEGFSRAKDFWRWGRDFKLVEKRVGSKVWKIDEGWSGRGRRELPIIEETLDTSEVEPGKHVVEYKIAVRLWPPYRTDGSDDDEEEPAGEIIYAPQMTIEVLPKDGPSTVKVLNDEALRSQLEQFCTVDEPTFFMRDGDRRCRFQVRFKSGLPCGIAFDVFLQAGGRECKFRGIVLAKGRGGRLTDRTFNCKVQEQYGNEVKILLRANPDLALETMDIFEVFGGDLELGPFVLEAPQPTAS